MFEDYIMDTRRINSNKILFSVSGHNIAIDQTVVDEYEKTVCPLSEKLLSSLIYVFGKNDCTDSVLSRKIELDMAKELEEYAI